MNDDSSPAAEPRTVSSAPIPATPIAVATSKPPARAVNGPLAMLLLLVTLIAIAALAFAWSANQRVRSSERELVQRQQDSTDRVLEATVLARQAQDGLREPPPRSLSWKRASTRRRCSAASSRT